MQTAKDTGNINYHDLVVDAAVAKVSVVGIGMRSHAGVAAQMFQALHREGINIKVITTLRDKNFCPHRAEIYGIGRSDPA